MSFRELAVTIAAHNEVSAEFAKVSSDAAHMASEVASHPIILQTENLATAEIHRVAEDAAHLKSEVEATPIRVAFEPIEVPPIPPIDVSPIHEASVAFREAASAAAEVEASVWGSAASFTEFSEACNASAVSMGGAVVQSREFTVSLGEVKTASESTAVSIRTVASTLMTFAGLSTAVISLAGDLGLVDKESAKWARTMLSVITITSTWIRLKSYLTTITAGHTAATAVNTTVQSANASTSIASAVAHKVYAAACSFATLVQNSLNISYATFLALTGVGLAVIAAAAVAMWSFASSMNAATSSVQGFNEATSEMPSRGRSITRAGEEEMYRRGVE